MFYTFLCNVIYHHPISFDAFNMIDERKKREKCQFTTDPFQYPVTVANDIPFSVRGYYFNFNFCFLYF